MCHYTDILGSGGVLAVQLLTAVSIVSSIGFWVLVYRWQNVGLRQYALPIILWIIFGTLDIVITAKGAYNDPLREGNPLARAIFIETGFLGPVVASVLWIALWAGLVLVINKKIKGTLAGGVPLAQFLSLAVFYSLAAGHFGGFGSWFVPMCGISKLYSIVPGMPGIVTMIAAGSTLAVIPACVASFWAGKKRQTI
jgi:hypothetical protein